MAFHWYKNDTIAVDDLISTILTQLKDIGGWIETDAGYNVVTDPNSKFDVFFYLEVNGTPEKRFIQMQVGNAGQWNTGTHVMDAPKHTFSMIMRDSGTTVAGTETGVLILSYDDDHIICIIDYSGQGAGWNRVFGYLGLCTAFGPSDECLIGAATSNQGASTIPAGNDITTEKQIIYIMNDVSGSATKKKYNIGTIMAFTNGITTYCIPSQSISSAVVDKKYLIPIYLMSNSALPAGGEDAGIRCSLTDTMCGGIYDGIANGQILTADDGKTWWYYIAITTQTAYQSLPYRVLIRKS